MTKQRKAPYSHADGSNCWTKDCRRRKPKLVVSGQVETQTETLIKNINETLSGSPIFKTPEEETHTKTASGLNSRDILTDNLGNYAVIYETYESNAMPGFMTVETEFGFLYLDPQQEVTTLGKTHPYHKSAQEFPMTVAAAGEKLSPGDSLVGDHGNICHISDIYSSSSQPGLLAVETEFGVLYLDPSGDYLILDK